MSYDVDYDFVPDVKELGQPPLRIGLGFNLGLFTVVSLMGIFRFLTASPLMKGASLEGIVFSALLDMVRVVVVVLVSAAFLEEFWNRLVATIWPVRAIDFQEAVAIVLMLSLLFGV